MNVAHATDTCPTADVGNRNASRQSVVGRPPGGGEALSAVYFQRSVHEPVARHRQ
jgi:hypothetical protein